MTIKRYNNILLVRDAHSASRQASDLVCARATARRAATVTLVDAGDIEGDNGLSRMVSVISGPVRNKIGTRTGLSHKAMARQDHSWIASLFNGGTPETILNHVSCSVLAAKGFGFVSPVRLDERGAR